MCRRKGTAGFAAAGCILIIWFGLAACVPRAEQPSPQLREGKGVFAAYCARCHATTGETVVVGPSLAGIATRAGSRIPGLDAETYIRDSIAHPDAYVVEGFPKGIMPPNLSKELPPERLDAVVAYLLTLQSPKPQ